MEASVQVFTSVIESIQMTHKQHMEEIEARHDAEQIRFKKLIKELRQEITKLEKKSVELQQLSHIEDHISLAQVSGRVCYVNVRMYLYVQYAYNTACLNVCVVGLS